MQKSKDNIIKFESDKKEWEDVNGDVTQFKNKLIFKNCSLVDIENNNAKVVDILVENGKIVKISESIKAGKTDYIDLEGDFVLPPFDNPFMSSEIFNFKSEKDVALFKELMVLKNVLGGVLFLKDEPLDSKVSILLENMDELEENELSEISDLSAKENLQIFLKVGQSLEELGTVDKKFGKSLPLVLEDFGILDRDWVLVGGNCFEKDDLRIFREHGDKYIICPYEDGQAGRRPVNLLTLKNLDFDIKIGSGSAFEIDYFAYIRQVLMTQWSLFEDKNCLTEKEAFLMTTNKATTLVEGEDANFIVVRREPTLYPTVLQNLIWGKSKKDVTMTVMNGRILQTFGEIESGVSGLNYQQIINKIIKSTKKEK